MIADELVLAVVAFALFISAAWFIIRLLKGPGPRQVKSVEPAKPVRAVCGCDHHHSFHDPETGECHSFVKGEAIQYDIYKTPTAWSQAQCPCRQYSGPVPLPEYFAPEIEGTEGTG